MKRAKRADEITWKPEEIVTGWAADDARIEWAISKAREVRAHVQQVADVCDLAERLRDELAVVRGLARRLLAMPDIEADMRMTLRRMSGEVH